MDGLFHVALLLAVALQGATLPLGQPITEVTCAADRSQSYALYLPSTYSPTRSWPLIVAFDPGGRGRTPVERYQAAAEQYGFIVAGSNNSRNGSPDTARIVSTMSRDLADRFAIDEKRVYLAGMSGGARVALAVALATGGAAGVIASSAGFIDARPRRTVPFPLFATTGTEDFNHLEMRQLDRELTSPHHLAIFSGGHVWLSAALATEAVEWMELQAMRTALKPRDEREIDSLLAKRTTAVEHAAADVDRFLALQAIVSDFDGLRDVSSFSARARELAGSSRVRAALKQASDEDDREERLLVETRREEAQLSLPEDRFTALADLRRSWKELSQQARKTQDSAERRVARRVMAALAFGATSPDPDYLKIIREYRF